MRTCGGPTDGHGGAGIGPTPPDGGHGAPWPAWMTDAACAGVGVGEFFGPDPAGWRWCRCCPVVECCFWWAMVVESDAGYRFGIWGGATPATRERVAAVVGTSYARVRLTQSLCDWAGTTRGPPAERRAG